MQKYGIAAILVGGLLVAPAAMAQSANVAYATGQSRSEHMIFLERGNQLPMVAAPIVRTAVDAAKAGKTVHIVGRGDQAEVVKQEMIREGAPAKAIVVDREAAKPLPKPGDSISDPGGRKVDIKF